MADAIVRLKVESQEYDSKLKRATDQMTRMEQEVRRTGASFAYADKEEIAFVQSLGQMGTQAQSAKQKMREYADALTSLTATYRAMSDEEKNSEFGKAMAASIDQISVKAAQFKDIMADTNATIARQASDTAAFDSLAGGIGTAVAAFQTLNGAMQLFGVEDENAVQAIAKLQAAMAVTNGLTQIQTALQKQSAMMLGVTAVQEKAAAVAIELENVAKGKNIVVTKAATVAQKALNAVAKANPYILLATAIAAVGVALYEMSKRSREAERAEEQRLKLAEEAEQRANATREAFVNASGEAMNSASRISSLQTAYMKANSEMEKTGILKQAQTEFKKLGIECNSLTNAQTLLVNKGVQIIELMRMQGTVAALSAIRMEKFKESFNNLLANGYDVQGAAALAGANSQVRELDDQINSLQTKIASSQSALGVGEKKSKPIKVSVEPEMPEGSAAALQKKLSELNKQWSMATSDEDRAGIKKQINEAQKALDAMNGKVQPIEVPITFTEQGMSELGKQIKDQMSQLEIGSGDYLIAANNLLDFTTFQNLLKAATERGVHIDPEWMASLFEDIKVGADVDESTWQALLDNLNQQLQDKELEPFKLNFKTGNLEEVKVEVKTAFEEMKESLDNLGKGVGAISTIGNAFNDLKGIGEDLANAFSGEMDAWDALMTVFNSGISIMQTVIGVMEAINTLTELSTSLKGANTAATELEATTAQTSAMTEVTAEGEKQMASELTTGTNTMEAASGAGKAMSAIPIVGPILAVAAIAAVLAAIMASKSKAKSAGKFATGGIVPGNNYNDGLVANVSSGELILNRAQQDSIAGQLSNSNPLGNLQLSTEISGTNLRIVMNNDNRSKGGSRGYYANIH